MLLVRYDRRRGEKLLAGVDLGVERGVEWADSRPLGRASWRLSIFSFSSGTSTIMQAEERLRPTEFLATHVYSPSSSGYTRGMLSVALVPSKDIT